MSREQHVTVYFDDHSKGHVFYYRDPKSKTYKAVVSAEAYDTETACEDSAWFCLFATKEEMERADFNKYEHCKVVSIH
jgi:hypothetical protein